LTCEEGARLRNLDLKSAHEDAIMWWKFGKVPARESIKNYDKNQFAPFENAKYGDVQKQTRERYLETLDKIVELENKYNNKPNSVEKSEFKKNKEGYYFKSPSINDITYPELFIPIQLSELKVKLPPSKLYPPSKPIYKAPVNHALYLYLLAMLVFLILAITEDNSKIANVVIVLVLALLGSLGLSGKKSKSEMKFKKELENYEKEIVAYRIKLKNEFSVPDIKRWRKEQLKTILKNSGEYRDIEKISAKGKAEEYFYSHLVKFFGKGKIIKDVQLGKFDKPYVPDFIYFDPTNNLKIDIEIDEPYSLSTNRELIHYIEKDTKRNDFFKSERWFVIRFSEEQVIRFPERCCKFIYKVVSDLNLNDPILDEKFSMTSDLPIFKKWTLEEAIDLKDRGYRDTVLEDVYFSTFH
jgi:very-short-patch-repair endonuclease